MVPFRCRDLTLLVVDTVLSGIRGRVIRCRLISISRMMRSVLMFGALFVVCSRLLYLIGLVRCLILVGLMCWMILRLRLCLIEVCRWLFRGRWCRRIVNGSLLVWSIGGFLCVDLGCCDCVVGVGVGNVVCGDCVVGWRL